jgi:3-methyladenine DNA glycosylase/8-oxoguanine DNA glycosylase
MKFSIPVPRTFNFWATVYSHGWCVLPPFRMNEEERLLSAVVPNGNGGYDDVAVSAKKNSLVISLEERALPSRQKISRITKYLYSMLRMDEPLDEFYAEAKKFPRYRWISKIKAGRLLRCPTVFEDAVKMICTTNCSWALTEVMTDALVTKLGTRVRGDVYAFPTPEAIAACSESFLRKEIRCGYRAPYILELSKNIAAGKISLETWRTSELPTGELFEQVRSVKGIGPYAAGNILKLLGRYDYLGLDSWGRGKFYELFKNGRKVKDSTIEKHYAPFGKWRGLFLWMDMTKEWHTKAFPF